METLVNSSFGLFFPTFKPTSAKQPQRLRSFPVHHSFSYTKDYNSTQTLINNVYMQSNICVEKWINTCLEKFPCWSFLKDFNLDPSHYLNDTLLIQMMENNKQHRIKRWEKNEAFHHRSRYLGRPKVRKIDEEWNNNLRISCFTGRLIYTRDSRRGHQEGKRTQQCILYATPFD